MSPKAQVSTKGKSKPKVKTTDLFEDEQEITRGQGTSYVQSERGEKGEPGPQGERGEKGEPGPQGERGEKGDSIDVSRLEAIEKRIAELESRIAVLKNQSPV